MIETLYIARHGFRMSWENPYWTPLTATPRDPPLSSHGVDQAKELSAYVAGLPENERPQMIFSSPYYRCLQTASPMAKALGLPIHIEHGIAEWYLPASRGLHPQPEEAEKLQAYFPDVTISTEHSSLVYPERKGETQEEIHKRAEAALVALLTHLDKQYPEVKRVILFTHAATNIALGHALIHDDNADIRSATCSLSQYDAVQRVPGAVGSWIQKRNGDVSFLTEGEERHWEFSYVEAYEETGIEEDGSEAGPLASDVYKGGKL